MLEFFFILTSSNPHALSCHATKPRSFHNPQPSPPRTFQPSPTNLTTTLKNPQSHQTPQQTMPSEPPTPSWVFSYLPAPKPAPPPTIPSTATTTPISNFFTSLRSALSTPKLNLEEQRIATLQGVKTSLEQQIAYRQKAGLSTRDLEREQMGRIDEALRGLGGGRE